MIGALALHRLPSVRLTGRTRCATVSALQAGIRAQTGVLPSLEQAAVAKLTSVDPPTGGRSAFAHNKGPCSGPNFMPKPEDIQPATDLALGLLAAHANDGSDADELDGAMAYADTDVQYGAADTGHRKADDGDGARTHTQGGRRRKEELEKDWEPGGSGSDSEGPPVPQKKRGGGGKRLTAEEREERERAKAAEKAAKAAERIRIREEKAAQKAAKAAEKEDQKRAKAAQKEAAKEAVKEQKEASNALKATMVGRYMRVVMSNCLAAAPLGIKMVDLIPTVRSGQKDQTFPHEQHKDMPLAARGYKYCMWGVRLPGAAAARVQAAEGCALELINLPDPDATGRPLLLFPALLLVLSGDELLVRLEADPSAPLVGLHHDVLRAHPGASLLVYVIGLPEALRRRERANKSFNRMAIEDLLFDVAVGMPAVRLQYDCPEHDLARAATDILNLGYALSQQPRKRLEAYLDTFGSKSTVPLRAIKDVLSEQGGPEQLTLCDALSNLVAPQRAAAVAAEYPSLAALIEALRARPEGRLRDRLLAQCRIPGAVPAKRRQQVAGPVAAANLALFLLTQDGRGEWKEAAE